MYSILIVDDEALIRQGIVGIIDWRSLGIDRIYEAEDGQDAWEIIRQHEIDIVLTDIVMPFMDGLELTKKITAEYPNILVVILSGYDDFQYAKQAIDLGVSTYVLKPVGAKTLREKLEKVLEKIEDRQTQRNYLIDIRYKLNSNIPIIKETYLNALVCKRSGNKEKILSKCRSVELDFHSSKYMVGVIHLDLEHIEENDLELYTFAGKNIAFDCVGGDHYIFENAEGHIVILFQEDSMGEDARTIGYQTMEVILKALDLTIGVRATAGVGIEVTDLMGLYRSYRAAERACEFRFSLGNDVVYDVNDEGSEGDIFDYPSEKIREFLKSIRFFDERSVIRDLADIQKYMTEQKALSGINIKILLTELVTEMLKEISKAGGTQQEIIGKCFELYSKINHMLSLEQIMNEIQNIAIQILHCLRKIERSGSAELIERVKVFVEQNYGDPRLTLAAAANHAAVSTGYLSALFKKEADINFTKYVADIRMNKAMELMRTTDMKLYEISDKIGFENTHYFSIAFKKYTGMSPSEFRSV